MVGQNVQPELRRNAPFPHDICFSLGDENQPDIRMLPVTVSLLAVSDVLSQKCGKGSCRIHLKISHGSSIDIIRFRSQCH